MLSSHARLLRPAALAAVVAIATGAVPVAATSPGPGHRTAADPMLVGHAAGTEVTPLISVGETLPGGYVFDSIPDGIALQGRGEGRADVWLNHETSLVPFPYVAAAPTAANSQNDFQNSTLSHLILNQQAATVLAGSTVLPSEANYQRFCSSYLATAAEGFERDLLFLNEEATDVVNRTGTAWPAEPAFGGSPEQAGVVVAYDVKSGEYRTIYGMGRLNHENSVAIPGYDERMLLTGDDTFTTDPAQSQVYAYFADSANAVWNDEGSLWGFRATDWATYDDYYDVAPGSPVSIEGEFVELPRAAATGDQAALQAASNDAHVFRFTRVEDIAYDRNDPHIVYIADSGRATTNAGANPFASRNGRVWRMVLDPANPRHVLGLSVLIEGETLPLASEDPAASAAAIHQPDNLETTAHGLFITEDPSSANNYNPGQPGATGARVWWYHLDGSMAGTREVALTVDQSADESAQDIDPGAAAKLGAWEASGIVDASTAFGPGAFLVDVQAHSLWIETAPGPDLKAPAGPDWTYKREGGQLLLVRIPGA